MGGQCFFNTTNISQFLEVCIHFLITKHRKKHTMFPAIFIGGILLQYLQWYFHQWDVTHDFGLLSPLSYPPDTVRVLHDMFLSQTMNIRESQTGEQRKKHQSKGDGNKENQTERVVKQRFCGCLPLQPNSKERQDNASFPLPSHYLSCYQLKAKKQHS